MATRAPVSAARATPVFRYPTFEDSTKIGMMVAAGLGDAPSAPIDRDELGADLEQAGRDFVSAHIFGNEAVILAEVGSNLAALARLVPREFARGAHIGTLQLLVAPGFRRHGLGKKLLAASLEEGFAQRGFVRIELPIAEHDLVSARLVSSPAWTITRVERQALCVFGDYYDITVWVTDPPLR